MGIPVPCTNQWGERKRSCATREKGKEKTRFIWNLYFGARFWEIELLEEQERKLEEMDEKIIGFWQRTGHLQSRSRVWQFPFFPSIFSGKSIVVECSTGNPFFLKRGADGIGWKRPEKMEIWWLFNKEFLLAARLEKTNILPSGLNYFGRMSLLALLFK